MKKSILTIITLLLTLNMYAPLRSEKYIYIFRLSPITKGFMQYADDLGFKESGNNLTKVNKIGCFAEHQWRESTLHFLGYKEITLKKFKKDPSIFPREKQLEALKKLVAVNKQLLIPYNSYIGKTIKGIPITQSGLIAACHLGGFNSVKLFLTSKGKINKRDINGTKVSDYIKQFRGYSL